MPGFQPDLLQGSPPNSQLWVLRALEAMMPGLREQNASNSLTHESFYFVVDPFLEVAQFSTEQKAWIKNKSAHEHQRQTVVVDNDLPISHDALSVFNSKALHDLMSIRESLDRKRSEREDREKRERREQWAFKVLEGTVTNLRENKVTELKKFDCVVRRTLRNPEQVLGVELIDQILVKRVFYDFDDNFNDQGMSDHDFYNAEDSGPSQDNTTQLAKTPSHSNKRRKPLAVTSICNSKLVQDHVKNLVKMRELILVGMHEKAKKRKVILLQWTKRTSMVQVYQEPIPILVDLHHVVNQLANGQLAKNWQQYTRLRDEWASFCNFLDSATSRALRSSSFREECAIWTSQIHEPARCLYQNGMGTLGLPWLSVARFMGLLKIWGLQNQDRTDDVLVKSLTVQLCQLLWFNFMRYTGPDSFPNRVVEPRLAHFTNFKSAAANLLYYHSDESGLEEERRKEDEHGWRTIKNHNASCSKDQSTLELRYWDFEYRTPLLDLSYIIWLAYEDYLQDDYEHIRLLERESLASYHGTDLDEEEAVIQWPVSECYNITGFGRSLPWRGSCSPHPKEYYARQCLSAFWVLFDNATTWVTNWARRSDQKLRLYRLALLPLCRGIYALLNFETPADELRSILLGSRRLLREDNITDQPIKALVPLLLQMKAADGIDGLVNDPALDGLSGVDLLDMIDYIIDVSVDSHVPSNHWPGPQIHGSRHSVWLSKNVSSATEVDDTVLFPRTLDDPDPVGGDDFDEEPSVEHDSDSDSVCPEGSLSVSIDISDEVQPKPTSVCKSWFDSGHMFQNGRRINSPSQCKWQGTKHHCMRLHPDLSRPGLCWDWLKNKCNDVHCDLAHDDPLYPRNMHVADLYPSQIPGRQVTCTFWQQDNCPHGETCRHLHLLPNGKVKYACPFLHTFGGCRNLDDRCKYLHDDRAPSQPSLYYSSWYDPSAPLDQPDRRPLNLAQPTAGGGVRIICRNMLLKGYCWRGDNCWLEHKTDGVKVTNQNEPITLTIQECWNYPNCPLDIHCEKLHPGTNLVKFNPNEVDICPFYYQHGSCRFHESHRCRHIVHVWAGAEELKTVTKRPSSDVGDRPRKRTKQDVTGDTSPAAPEPSAPKMNEDQSGFHSQSGNTYVSPSLFPACTPEMFDPVGSANFSFSQSNGAIPHTFEPQRFGTMNQNSPSGACGPIAGSNLAMLQWQQPWPQKLYSASNRTGPVCHHCNGVGHIKRQCPQKMRDNFGKMMAPIPNAVPGAYVQHQLPSKYMRPYAQAISYPSHISSPFTPFSERSSQQIPLSTPMSATSPYPRQLPGHKSAYGFGFTGYGARHNFGDRNAQEPNHAKLNGTPTAAPRSNFGPSHPPAFAPPPGPRPVPRQPRMQAPSPQPPLADRMGSGNSQHATKRKCNSNDQYDSPAPKRHRSAGADGENKCSESQTQSATESHLKTDLPPQIVSRVRKAELYQPPPQRKKRPAREALNSEFLAHKRQKRDTEKNVSDLQARMSVSQQSSTAPGSTQVNSDPIEEEKRRKRAQRFAKPPAP
ncbi:hypothetical protein PMIN02_004508 [Paraphaeosphaeria minitans]